MKVNIGPYLNFIGPYQIAKFLFFFLHEDTRNRIAFWLATDKDGEDSWLTKVCQWIYEKRKRRMYVKIDRYDTWSADHTLALIILPTLKAVKEDKVGVPGSFVDQGGVVSDREFSEARKLWEEALDKMIYAFEYIVNDDWDLEISYEEKIKTDERIQEGLSLFAKHYRSLWS